MKSNRTCPKCGYDNKFHGSAFCSTCGAKIPVLAGPGDEENVAGVFGYKPPGENHGEDKGTWKSMVPQMKLAVGLYNRPVVDWCDRIWNHAGGSWDIEKLRTVNLSSTLGIVGIVESRWPDDEKVKAMSEFLGESIGPQIAQQYDFPFFCVTKEILKAALLTNPPPVWDFESNPGPFPAFAFLLEEGALTSPDGTPVNVLYTTQATPEEVAKCPVSSLYDARDWKGMLVNCAYSVSHGQAWFSKRRIENGCCDIAEHLEYAESEVLGLKVEDVTGSIVDVAHGSKERPTTPELEEEFCNKITALNFTLTVLLNSSRPDTEGGYLEKGGFKKNHPKSKRPIYTPNVLGRNYKIRSSVTGGHSTGDGPKVRTHWRRGHFRSQRFGPRRKFVRTVWIEPILVNK